MSADFIFLGDSITCADRFFDETHSGLGDGYVYQLSCSPLFRSEDIRCINKGFDGLTCQALLSRLRDGRITLPNSDMLFLQIGINDVGVSLNTGVTLKDQKFGEAYHDLLQYLKKQTRQLICLTPFLFPEPAEYLNWNNELSFACDSITDLCRQYHIPCFSLQSFFTELQTDYPVSVLTSDGIHLTHTGHSLLAEYIITQIRSLIANHLYPT